MQQQGETEVTEGRAARIDESRSGEIKLGETCDVCGRVVDDPHDAHRAELTVSGAMCPSPMVFHKECYEKASAMWQPDPDSYCTVDPEFPETGQWTLPENNG